MGVSSGSQYLGLGTMRMIYVGRVKDGWWAMNGWRLRDRGWTQGQGVVSPAHGVTLEAPFLACRHAIHTAPRQPALSLMSSIVIN